MQLCLLQLISELLQFINTKNCESYSLFIFYNQTSRRKFVLSQDGPDLKLLSHALLPMLWGSTITWHITWASYSLMWLFPFHSPIRLAVSVRALGRPLPRTEWCVRTWGWFQNCIDVRILNVFMITLWRTVSHWQFF